MKNWIESIWSFDGVGLLLIATVVNALIAFLYQDQYLIIYSGVAWGFVLTVNGALAACSCMKGIIRSKRICDANEEFKKKHRRKYDE